MTSIAIPSGLVPRDIDHTIQQGLFTPQAGPEVLKAFKALMGYMSDRRLVRLLGCKDPSYISRWRRGRSNISQLYLGRMFILVRLKVVDLFDFAPVYAINWETGRALSKKEYEDEWVQEYENQSPFTTIGRHISEDRNRSGTSMVRLGSEPSGEPSILPRPKATISG